MRVAKRALTMSVAAAVGLAAAATINVSPASAATTIALGPSTWAYIDSQAPQTPFVNPAGDAPVGTLKDDDGNGHTYRSFFTYDLTQVPGEVIYKAHLFSRERAVTDCEAGTAVELWRTGPVETDTTWKKQPAEVELIDRRDMGGEQPCPVYFEFDMAPAIIAALARQEKSLTIELRVAGDQEADSAYGRRVQVPKISIEANYRPAVTSLGLSDSDRPCGTLVRPSKGNNSASLKATATDRDDIFVDVTFAIWPVGAPEQRTEVGGSGYNADTFVGRPDLSGYPEGTVLAWNAQAKDRTDVSAWSEPCYLVIDRTAPTTAPKVSSNLYQEGDVASGGEGMTGKIRFDAQGDRDITKFHYRDDSGVGGSVAARRPGGRAVIEYTPRRWGRHWIEVTAYDGARNRGVTTRYEFVVRDTAPSGNVDMAGVGLPSKITLSSSAADATEFSYQIDGETEVKFPAVDGRGSSVITFTKPGGVYVTLRTYAGEKAIGVDKLYVSVTDAPVVESTDFGFTHDGVIGKAGTFTFKPRTTNVVAYVYNFGDGPYRINANPDGSAVLTWTPTAARSYRCVVQSVRADGSLSEQAVYRFDVMDVRPTANASELTYWPRIDGVGLPLEITMESRLPDLTGFAYRFNGGEEQTISTDGSSFASVKVTPPHAGDNSLVFQALLADGTRSPEATFTFQTFSGPLVTWKPDGDATVGMPLTFTFTPGLPDVKEYRFSFNYGDQQTVAADADGTATVTYTPSWSGYSSVDVTSIGTDGTESETRTQDFGVQDNTISSSR